jgi:glycosyltransferase involved in cell wall biosynthesis
LKIVLLARSLGVGGAEGQIVVLARGFRQRGHDVSVALFYGDGPRAEELHDSGIPLFDLKKSGRWDLLPFFIRLLRMTRRIQPDVIYGFLGPPNMSTALLKPFLPRTKMVWGVRSSHVDLQRYDWLSRLSYRLECRLSRFADLVICNSWAGLEYAAAHGFPSDKLTVIHNGLDPDQFAPDPVARERIRREWRVAGHEILIGIVARLDPMKDHPTFLQAAAMLVRERQDVRFVCVGDGPEPYAAHLYRLATELGLDGRLIWAGTRHDMTAVYNALDIASSSSTGEGFSNVLAEAMACGVPCVVTDVGDSALIVDPTGCVVPPAMAAALYQGFCKMLTRLSADLRREARASILRRFTNDGLVATTLNALQGLLTVKCGGMTKVTTIE